MTHPRLNSALSDLGAMAGFFAAVVAGLLPRRYWNGMTRLPVESAAVPSAVVTAAIGLVAGARGFLTYVQAASDALAQQTLEAAMQQASAPPGGAEITTLSMQVVSITAVFAFVLFTPLGWLTVYLTATGVYRLVAASIGHPAGDPLLTVIDHTVRRFRTRRVAARAVARRTREEGPDTADRLFTGAGAGLSGVDFIVVAARQKPEWTPGTIVTTPDGWFRVGDPFDARLPFGLRRVYPLRRLETIEVLRKVVSYEFPPLQRGPGPLQPEPTSGAAPGTGPSAGGRRGTSPS